MIDEYVKKWLIKAHNDLEVAENLMKLSSGEAINEAICFHSKKKLSNKK